MKQLNIIEDGLIVFGVTIGLTQIQTILGIIILVFQILLIMTKGIIKIVDAIKKKNLEDVEKIVDETKQEIDDIRKNTPIDTHSDKEQ